MAFAGLKVSDPMAEAMQSGLQGSSRAIAADPGAPQVVSHGGAGWPAGTGMPVAAVRDRVNCDCGGAENLL
jgi:hypothetical protein